MITITKKRILKSGKCGKPKTHIYLGGQYATIFQYVFKNMVNDSIKSIKAITTKEVIEVKYE